MAKENGFAGIPNWMCEYFMFGDFLPLTKTLFWIIRNTMGWSRLEYKVDNFTEEALKMKMSYPAFKRSLYHWQTKGFIELSIQKRLLKIDYSKMATQLCIVPLLKNGYFDYSKLTTQKLQNDCESRQAETLKKDLKKDIKKCTNNTENIDEEVEEIIKEKSKPEIDTKMITKYLRKTRFFKNIFYTQVADVIYEYGQESFIRSVEICEKKHKLPCNAVAYLKGVIKNEALAPSIDEEEPEPMTVTPEPEVDLDPIWGQFEPYKKYFKECKKAIDLKLSDGEDYTPEEIEAKEEIDDYFVNIIIPAIQGKFPGYAHNIQDPRLDELFKAYGEMEEK